MLDRPNSLRRVAVFTGKRGGFGAMLRIMRLIDADPAMELKVIASDMHLNPTFGATIEEVRSQIPISKVVDLSSYGDAPLDRARALGRCVERLAQARQMGQASGPSSHELRALARKAYK